MVVLLRFFNQCLECTSLELVVTVENENKNDLLGSFRKWGGILSYYRPYLPGPPKRDPLFSESPTWF